MKADALSYFHMPLMTLVGLGIFFTFFITMLIWVFRRQGKPFYHQMANLALGED